MTTTNGTEKMNVKKQNSWQINNASNEVKNIHTNTILICTWWKSLMYNATRNISDTNTTALLYLPTTPEHFPCTHTAGSKTINVV
jgi:hypothetical protein